MLSTSFDVLFALNSTCYGLWLLRRGVSTRSCTFTRVIDLHIEFCQHMTAWDFLPNDDGTNLRARPDHSQEELAKARRAEREAAQLLEGALSRCAKTEESLAQACDERLSFQCALREAEGARAATAEELNSRDRTPVLAQESRDATSQTTETYKQYCDPDQSLLRLKEDLELARVNLDASKKRTADLQQQLADSTTETTRAMREARHNNALAVAREEEFIRIYEREQVSPSININL